MRVLTNSLAANDVAMVYGGYAKARPDLLAGGVKFWELKPGPGGGENQHVRLVRREPAYQGAGSDSAVFRRQLQPGPTIDFAQLRAGRIRRRTVDRRTAGIHIRRESTGERAWSVTLHNGKLRWTDGTRTYDSSPEASAGQKFQAWLAKVLPLDSQL